MDSAALRMIALSQRDNKKPQVKSEVVLARIVRFLNSDLTQDTVEDVYPPKSPLARIKSRFVKIVMDNNLSELVYPVITNDDNDNSHVYLVKLVEPLIEDEDEDEIGVEVEA